MVLNVVVAGPSLSLLVRPARDLAFAFSAFTLGGCRGRLGHLRGGCGGSG